MSAQWLETAHERSGLLRTSELVAAGVPPTTISTRVGRGVWWRPLPGVVATFPKMELTRDQKRVCALLWLPDCALLSHYDAAREWGFDISLPDDVHMSVDREHNPRPQPGYLVHRRETLLDQDRAVRRGIPLTALERTIVDTFDIMGSSRHRRGLVAEAFRRRRTIEPRLLGVAARVPKLHRREELIATIAMAAGGSHSGREMDHFEWLTAAGFGGFERQFPVLVGGRVRWLDGCDPILRICYQVDGPVHDRPDVREADEALDLALVGDGWVVVRLRTDRTRREPHAVVEELTRLRVERRRLVDLGVLAPAVRANGYDARTGTS